MRESAMATAITAATIPSPPIPSTRMFAMLISAGVGGARRLGTNVGGVPRRFRARTSESTRPPAILKTRREDSSGSMAASFKRTGRRVGRLPVSAGRSSW